MQNKFKKVTPWLVLGDRFVMFWNQETPFPRYRRQQATLRAAYQQVGNRDQHLLKLIQIKSEQVKEVSIVKVLLLKPKSYYSLVRSYIKIANLAYSGRQSSSWEVDGGYLANGKASP